MAKRKRLSFDSPVLPRISAEEAARTSHPGTPDPGAPNLDTAPLPAPAPIAGVVADASAAAALAEVSDTLASAREGGRLVLELPLAQVQLDYLVRDRIPTEDDEMTTLVESLRARGQQAPVEVTRLGPEIRP